MDVFVFFSPIFIECSKGNKYKFRTRIDRSLLVGKNAAFHSSLHRQDTFRPHKYTNECFNEESEQVGKCTKKEADRVWQIVSHASWLT